MGRFVSDVCVSADCFSPVCVAVNKNCEAGQQKTEVLNGKSTCSTCNKNMYIMNVKQTALDDI